MKVKAAVFYEVGVPFQIEELDLAEPRHGEVLVKVAAAGVYWPLPTQAGADRVKDRQSSSDHRLVWVDIELHMKSAGLKPPPVP